MILSKRTKGPEVLVEQEVVEAAEEEELLEEAEEVLEAAPHLGKLEVVEAEEVLEEADQ